MHASTRSVLVLLATALVGPMAAGQPAKGRTTSAIYYLEMTMWEGGAAVPNKLDVVVIGKVAEFEPEPVTALPFVGARKEHTATYTVANLKVEDRVLGAAGVTRIRVGFRTDGRDVALTPNMDGLFALSRHPVADFYLLVSSPVAKTDAKHPAELDRLKKVALAISDPVAALKAKDLHDRFDAAHYLLYRYQTPRGTTDREPIPDEENRLILALLAELPWTFPAGYRARLGDRLYPHRSILWFKLNPSDLRFQRPERPKPGDKSVDYEKLMDEATSKFLKENADRIRLTRFVQK